MKIAWIVDVWPRLPSHREEVRKLLDLGNEIVVVAGATESVPADERLRVHALPRTDAYRDHWQRSASVSTRAAFRALLSAERPDLVHVLHWRSLSRDLVFTAALERCPAVVSLDDLWLTCLIGTRILPRTGEACDAPLAAHPCIACAPRTPWVPIEAQYMAFAEHKSQILRELELARTVLVQSRAHGAAIRRFLGEDALKLRPFVDASESALIEVYEVALAAGAPVVAAARDGDWYSERMRSFAEEQWERGAREIGFRHA